jgi:hypothetical protein
MPQNILFHNNNHNTTTLTLYNNHAYGNYMIEPYIYVLINTRDYVTIHKHE